jgi:hypothetical protein
MPAARLSRPERIVLVGRFRGLLLEEHSWLLDPSAVLARVTGEIGLCDTHLTENRLNVSASLSDVLACLFRNPRRIKDSILPFHLLQSGDDTSVGKALLSNLQTRADPFLGRV